LEQQDLNRRLLLALALSFFVFIGYSYFFPPATPPQTENQTSAATHQTPSVETTSNVDTPVSSGAAVNAASAPVQMASTGLVTVKSDNFIMTVDEFGRISQVELLETKYHDEEGNNLKMLNVNKVKPLEIRFSDVKLNEEAFKVNVS